MVSNKSRKGIRKLSTASFNYFLDLKSKELEGVEDHFKSLSSNSTLLAVEVMMGGWQSSCAHMRG